MRRLILVIGALFALAASALAAPPAGFSDVPAQAARAADEAPRLGAQGSSPWQSVSLATRPGRTRTVAHDPTRSMLVVGSDEAGYWTGNLEPDAFTPWQPHGDELGGGVLHAVSAFAPPSFSTERYVVVRSRDQALRYSDDDGVTWTACSLPDGFQFASVRRLLSDGALEEVKYLVGYGYDPVADENAWLLARSLDAGATWVRLRQSSVATAYDLWSARYGASRIVFAEDNGNDIVVEESSNQGAAWSPVTTLAFQGGQLDMTIAASEATPAKVWLALSTDLWLWDGVSENTIGGISIQHGTLTASALVPDFLMWCNAPNTYWSNDGGVTVNTFPNASWLGDPTHINNQPTNVQSLVTFFTPTAPARAGRFGRQSATGNQVPLEYFYISTGSGTYLYSVGSPNTELVTSSLLGNQQIHDVSSLNAGPVWTFSLGLRDLGSLPFSGSTTPLGLTGGISTTPNDCGTVATNRRPTASNPYVLSQFSAGSAILTGGGEIASTTLPDGGVPNAFHTLIADPSTTGRWYWCADRLVQVDYDPLTDTFTQAGVGPAFVGLFTGLAAAPSNAQIRYAVSTGTGGGPMVFRTTNNWSSSIMLAGPAMNAPPGEVARVSIAVHPTNPNECILAGAGVVRTTDGTNFSAFEAGLPPGTGIYEVVYAGSPAAPWAATSSGVYRHNGTAWVDQTPAISGVPDVPFRAVEFVSWSNRLRFGTWGRGVWDYQLGTTSDADDVREGTLALAPRTNPVRDRAVLDYALPAAGSVTLDVLDVGGRRVASLESGWRDAGTHAAVLDARALRSGVYFARLATAQGTRTSRLVVTR